MEAFRTCVLRRYLGRRQGRCWILAVLLALAVALPGGLSGQDSPAASQRPRQVPPPAADATRGVPAQAGDVGTTAATQGVADRERLNLLGEVDSSRGEGRRNENVRLILIDNNVLRDLNRRMGTSATVITDFKIDQGYWGAEFGGQPSRPLHLPKSRVRTLHGNVYWNHDNSIFRARKFFHVGRVLPARRNDYGLTVSLPLWKGAAITVNASGGKDRGQENGNVLVPAADERTPLTTDPRIRPIVEDILSTYPDELPNRTDVSPRALNTNAPQNINNSRISGTLDQKLSEKDRLTLRYNFIWQKVAAFQLVAGQAPNTTTRNHQARITWSRTWTPSTLTDISVGFDRVGSLLLPDERSYGPWIRVGGELTALGPPGRFPVDRALNRFRYAARLRQVRGNHNLTLGFGLIRGQVNGSEVQDHRGLFVFRRDLGRDAVTNLRRGTPSNYTVAIGDVHRGFRNSTGQVYVGDEWKATPRLTLSLGLRWEPATRPMEVNHLTQVPYASDLNNFAPRFGFAYRLPEGWGVLRAAYGLHYGQIFTATYIQARLNPPQNFTVSVQAPDLADPLKDFDEDNIDPNARSSIYALSPDLRTPYSHTYNFAWELPLARNWTLDLGYVGSRSHKLLAMWFLNRAQPVAGIPQTTRTINLRRPDPRYYRVQQVTNGSSGYFDAARATLRIRQWSGFTIQASYWFSKAMDLGGSYINTAANANRLSTDSPSQFDAHGELRGLSNFDSPHAMLSSVTYQTPNLNQQAAWTRRVFANWQISAVVLLKAGMPFSVVSGSDAPGSGNVDGQTSDSPVLLRPRILGRSVDHPDTAIGRLAREAFGPIRPTDPRGNLGRNTFRRDGIGNVNFALSRRWVVTGEKALLLRAESLNLFNHPQFANPDGNLASRDFATITNTLNDGRTFRFTLQFQF